MKQYPYIWFPYLQIFNEFSPWNWAFVENWTTVEWCHKKTHTSSSWGPASLSHQHKSLSNFFCLVLSDHESNFLKLGEINDNNGSSQQESETSLIGKKEEIPWGGHETILPKTQRLFSAKSIDVQIWFGSMIFPPSLLVSSV